MKLPIFITHVDGKLHFKSLDDLKVLNIDSAMYADIVNFKHILTATHLTDNIYVVYDSNALKQAVERSQYEYEILQLAVGINTYLVVDTKRDVIYNPQTPASNHQ
jgi:hypothetical protein